MKTIPFLPLSQKRWLEGEERRGVGRVELNEFGSIKTRLMNSLIISYSLLERGVDDEVLLVVVAVAPFDLWNKTRPPSVMMEAKSRSMFIFNFLKDLLFACFFPN